MKRLDRDRYSPRESLGRALHAGAEEVAERVISRLAEGVSREEEVLSEDLLEAIALTDVEATRLLGRWVATGAAASAEEMGRLDALGMLVERLSLPNLVKAYLAWRDATIAVLEREAATIEADEDLVAEAREMVARSCDASLVRMARKHDGERRRLREELAGERAKLAHLALHDSLTGLANRRLLAERLEGALRAAARHGESVAVCFVDLDRFKAINDTFGHEAGDRLLRAFARRLSEAVRPSDMAARVGGDEFVVLCERLEGGAGEAAAIAERVLSAAAEPYPIGAHRARVSASVGIAVGSTSGEGERLLARADAAMYAAKQRGGSAHELYRETAGADAMPTAPGERGSAASASAHPSPLAAVGEECLPGCG